MNECNRRVVVTGLGVISPAGLSVDSLWEALVTGSSGIDYLTHFDPSAYDCKVAAEVNGFDIYAYTGRKQARFMDRFTQFALAASLQAVEASHLPVNPATAENIGVIIGSSICGLLTISEQVKVLHERGPQRVSPTLAPTMTGDAAAIQVSIHLGTKGVSFAPSSTCSSGSDAIGQAYDLIRQGDIRAAVAGGAEVPLVPLIFAAFNNMRALSTRNGNPKEACRPFDAERDGLVLGEGAAVVVLEELSYALERGALILAELIGYGATSDSFHLTQPSPEGKQAVRATRLALQHAGVTPEEIDYIHAHGTATLLNDRTETTVIKTVFGERAKRIPVSTTKPVTGHLLGASGSIGAVVTLLAMRHNTAPPTINLTHPDPECDLDYVPNQARKVSIRTAMSNSFGFGGHNSVLIFRKYE